MEKTKKRRDVNNWIILILIVIILLLSAFSMIGLKKADKCVSNPFVYGANELSRTNNAELRCSCSLDGKPSIRIDFNTTGLYAYDVYGRG